MTLLPIVGRELRIAARKRSAYWLRAAAALALIVVGTWCFLVMQGESPQTVARTLFGVMTGIAGLYCLFCGVWCTAGCLSQEKRDGTLGLLFLTDLRGYDVVFGKMTATSLHALYGALAVVPMLAVPLLLGGVAPAEFGRMALVILDTLFLSLTLGIGVSALNRSPRIACLETFFLILFISVCPPLFSFWLNAAGKAPGWQTPLLLPSPGFAFFAAFDVNYKGSSAAFWSSLGTIQGLAWAFLVEATLAVPHSWQDNPSGALALRWRDHLQRWTFGDAAERRAVRHQLLNQNPFFWLSSRARLRAVSVWAALALAACVWAWGLARLHREWLNPFVYFLTAFFLNGLIKCWFAAEAGRQLAEDRRQGALELLLSTSLTPQDIVRGQRLALERQFLGPILVTLSALFLFLLATLSEPMDEGDHLFWTWLYLALMIMLVADVAALHWLGLWRSLTAANPLRTLPGTVLRILVLPWLGLALAAVFFTFWSAVEHRDFSSLTAIHLWLVFGLAADVGFGLWARQRLLSEFRRAAAERCYSSGGFWKSVWPGRKGI